MKKVMTIVLTICLLFSFASAACAAIVPITKDQYYARSTLSGDDLKYYDALYDSIQTKKPSAGSDYGISNKRALQIKYFVLYDSPEVFNEGGFYSKNEVKTLDDQITAKTQLILSLLNNSMSDYEKVKTIYNYLGSHISYDYEALGDKQENGVVSKQARDSQTIVGGLVNDTAVCSGISRTLQYLLYQIGVPCYVVSGAYNGDPHGWNIVELDGEWYNCNLTGDLDVIKKYDTTIYFLVDDSTMLKRLTVDKDLNPPLPACTSTKYMNISPAATATPEPASAPASATPVQTANATNTGTNAQGAATDDWDTFKTQVNNYINSLSDSDYQTALQKGKALNPLRQDLMLTAAKNIDPDNLVALDVLYGAGQTALADKAKALLLQRANAQADPASSTAYTNTLTQSNILWISLAGAVAAAVVILLLVRRKRRNRTH